MVVHARFVQARSIVGQMWLAGRRPVSFTSYGFLLLFLPVTLGLYLVTPAARRRVVLLLSGYAFYITWSPWFALLLLAITVVAYAFGRLIEGASNPRLRRALVTVGVLLNLAALGYFKYAPFALATLRDLERLWQPLEQPFNAAPSVLQVLLPMGLSFYAFNAIAYLVDVYRRQVSATRDPVTFAASMALFAALLNGPLLRQSELSPQLVAPRVTRALFASGATRFMVGFCKKLLIADTLAPLVQSCFSLPQVSAGDVWLGALA